MFCLQVAMTIILLLSLFLPDSWILGNAPDSSNNALYGILVGILISFSIEMAILAVVQEAYFPNFFFWLDLVGTISVIFDIGWITNAFLPNGTSVTQTSLVRATRAAKLGARYGRLLRLLRLMRFLKFLPCFSSLKDDQFEPTMSAIKKVSNELSNLLSLRTAMLVLILVIVVPFLSYPVHDFSANAWISTGKDPSPVLSAAAVCCAIFPVCARLLPCVLLCLGTHCAEVGAWGSVALCVVCAASSIQVIRSALHAHLWHVGVDFQCWNDGKPHRQHSFERVRVRGRFLGEASRAKHLSFFSHPCPLSQEK